MDLIKPHIPNDWGNLLEINLSNSVSGNDLVVRETLEDLDVISNQLESMGIKVHRHDIDKKNLFIINDKIILNKDIDFPFTTENIVQSPYSFSSHNVLRFGNQLVFLMFEDIPEEGVNWLQEYCLNTFDDSYKVHTVPNHNSTESLNTSFCYLNSDYVLVNPTRFNHQNCPQIFDELTIIMCPEPYPTQTEYNGSYELDWMHLNVLVINQKLCMVEENQILLMKELNSKGINTIPYRFRHLRKFPAGLHSFTLPIIREDN